MSNQNNSENFTKLYDAVRRSTDLNMTEKVIYSYLLAYRVNNDKVYPSYDYIASECGVSNQVVKRTLTSLENKRLIDRKGRGNKGSFTIYGFNHRVKNELSNGSKMTHHRVKNDPLNGSKMTHNKTSNYTNNKTNNYTNIEDTEKRVNSSNINGEVKGGDKGITICTPIKETPIKEAPITEQSTISVFPNAEVNTDMIKPTIEFTSSTNTPTHKIGESTPTASTSYAQWIEEENKAESIKKQDEHIKASDAFLQAIEEKGLDIEQISLDKIPENALPF